MVQRIFHYENLIAISLISSNGKCNYASQTNKAIYTILSLPKFTNFQLVQTKSTFSKESTIFADMFFANTTSVVSDLTTSSDRFSRSDLGPSEVVYSTIPYFIDLKLAQARTNASQRNNILRIICDYNLYAKLNL
jgi:hypothetical protein